MNTFRWIFSACLVSSTVAIALAQTDPVEEEKWKNGLLPTGTYVGPGTKVNMYNGNITQAIPITSLPGRAGHDVNIVLSYNSKQLVHEDLGGGTIACRWFNEAPHSGRWFLNVWPSLEVNGDNAYFSTPSGAVHLFEGGPFQYWPTDDGTNMVYDSYNEKVYLLDGSNWDFSDFQADEKIYHFDRWGNYITYQFDESEKLQKIIDTLGREVNFTLGIEDRIEQIKVKNHAGLDLVWNFAYEQYTFNPTSFGSPVDRYYGCSVDEAEGDFDVNLLSDVTLPNGLTYQFDYNTEIVPFSLHLTTTVQLVQMVTPTGATSVRLDGGRRCSGNYGTEEACQAHRLDHDRPNRRRSLHDQLRLRILEQPRDGRNTC